MVLKPHLLPIEPLPFSGSINRLFWKKIFDDVSAFAGKEPCLVGTGKPCRLGVRILRMMPRALSFYDAMDDFPAW